MTNWPYTNKNPREIFKTEIFWFDEEKHLLGIHESREDSLDWANRVMEKWPGGEIFGPSVYYIDEDMVEDRTSPVVTCWNTNK